MGILITVSAVAAENVSSISVTVPSGTNFLAILCSGFGGDSIPTTATFNGVPMTARAVFDGTFGNGVIFTLANPYIGTASAIINVTGDGTRFCVIGFSGVDNSVAPFGETDNNGSSALVTVTNGGLKAGDVMLGAFGLRFAKTVTISNGNSLYEGLTRSMGGFVVSLGASATLSWNLSDLTEWGGTSIVIRALPPSIGVSGVYISDYGVI